VSTEASSVNPPLGYRRALCCDCGQLRLVKANYWRGEIGEPDKHSEGGPRCLLPLKCRGCATVTRHAYLRDGDRYADYAEWTKDEYEERVQGILSAEQDEK
jgi:hypothetical protein